MTVTWQDLTTELDAWSAVGRQATLWWRDDDATDDTPELNQLLAVAANSGVPLSLAVIPASATPALAALLEARPATVTVLTHGNRHLNHAPPEQKKSEFPPTRPRDDMLEDIQNGLERLRRLFGEGLLPVFVPPWNRMAEELAPGLADLGFRGLSVYADRDIGLTGAPKHFVRADTHVDIVDWRDSRGFAGEDVSLGLLCHHLAARRLGQTNPVRPTGLLTHHLVHDRDCWDFLSRLVAETTAHPAVRWLDAREVFAPDYAPSGRYGP